MARELTYAQQAERSISKKYRKEIWTPFIHAIKEYELIQAGDRIAVCISGGKDSMLLAVLVKMLLRITEIPFEAVYLVMDPGYNEANRAMIEANAAKLEIPVTVFETEIFDVANSVPDGSPCYLCARMRRGNLYAKARELGCNKIALGHHFSDVIETTVMAMFYGAQLQGMMPKLHSTNFPGMELIRPLYCVNETAVKAWRDYNNLHFIQCACRFTDTCSSCRVDGSMISKRMETKLLIRHLKETNPYVETNIFNSLKNVSLDTLIAYKQKGTAHHFLDDY